jgi:hypothetical protein
MSKVFIYHFLGLMVTGPLTYLIVALFSGHQYAMNLGFGLRKSMLTFAMTQTMIWVCFVIPFGLVLH